MDKQICRLCCNNTGMYYIFETDNSIQRYKKIMYCCANVKVAKDDGLPTHICGVCDAELLQFYHFTLKCEEADTKLRLIKECKDEIPEVQLKSEELEAGNTSDEQELEIKSENVCDVYTSEFNNNSDLSDDTVPISNMKERKWLKNGKRKYKFKIRRKSSSKCICSVCGRKCLNPSTLKIHMRSHTNEKPYSCKSCDKKYKDSGSLKKHEERNHHKNRKRNFICDNCGKTFFSKSDVQIHMRTHTGETPYTCMVCSKKFTQLSSKLRHEKRHTGQKTETCHICNKYFYTKQELEYHYLVHTTEKKYLCSLCNSTFKYKNNLQKHIRRHLEPQRFVCNYCGCTFSMKGNLKIHISRQHSTYSGYCNKCAKHVPNIEAHDVIHSGVRPQKCNYCSKSYVTKNGLAHHVNFRHKFPDKHKCQVNNCNLSFPSLPMLDFHVAKHHDNVIPFSCDRCSRGFYRKSDLSRHKLGTHKERLSY